LFSHYASPVLSNILSFVLFKGTVDVPGVALGVYSREDGVQTKDEDRIINYFYFRDVTMAHIGLMQLR